MAGPLPTLSSPALQLVGNFQKIFSFHLGTVLFPTPKTSGRGLLGPVSCQCRWGEADFCCATTSSHSAFPSANFKGLLTHWELSGRSRNVFFYLFVWSFTYFFVVFIYNLKNDSASDVTKNTPLFLWHRGKQIATEGTFPGLVILSSVMM